MPSPEREDLILHLSRILDQWAEQDLGGNPDWGPLEAAIPATWCDGFMWMNRVEQGSTTIELYKHGITRRYLNLDHTGSSYRYTEVGYVPVPLGEAIDGVFEGLEAMGYDRETVYDEAFVRRRHEELRLAGWTPISTASLDGENIPDVAVFED